jgi:hypothetical protein
MMQKKLIALAISGLASNAFSQVPTTVTEIRGYPLDTDGHSILRKEEKRRTPNRNTGIAAAKRAAKKRRNKK